MKACDLFAGARGWEALAADQLDVQFDGVEILADANATASAAGFKTVAEDVRDIDPEPGEYDANIGSPPCTTFSPAGLGVGRRALDAVRYGIRRYLLGERPTFAELAALTGDERTALVLEPLRVALSSRPRFIAWEQVPPVLPVWEGCAEVLRAAGYSVATGNLHAEQYGVPQTRKRALLVARLDGPVSLPAPTHSRYHSRDPRRLDPGVLPWVSMAEAIGWGMTHRPYPTLASARTSGGPDREKVGGSGARANIYAEVRAGRWRPGPDGGVCRLSLDDAARLQTFPAGYPFQGNSSSRFLQVTNAVPPLLALAVLAELFR